MRQFQPFLSKNAFEQVGVNKHQLQTRRVHLSLKTKNHVHLQHTLRIPYIRVFLFVKSSYTCIISMIRIQVRMCIHKNIIVFIYSHQYKYIIILLNNNQPLSYVKCKTLGFIVKSLKTLLSHGDVSHKHLSSQCMS